MLHELILITKKNIINLFIFKLNYIKVLRDLKTHFVKVLTFAI